MAHKGYKEIKNTPYVKTVIGLVLALAIAALLVSNLPSNPSTADGATSARPVEVVWRGHITALIADFVNMTGGYTWWFLDLGNGTHVKLDLTNATIRLKDHFATYIGNFDKPVCVRGIWNGTVLKALEIFDTGDCHTAT